MGASFNAYTTGADAYDSLFGGDGLHSSPKEALSSDVQFDVKGLKAGTATITITAKSPVTGQTFTDIQHWVVWDASKAIVSDTPSQISLKLGQSYTFKLTASPEAIAQGILIDAWYYNKNDNNGELDYQTTYKGNGVYLVKVTAAATAMTLNLLVSLKREMKQDYQYK